MMIVVLGGACLCCVLSSAGLGGAYFLSESFKDWVDGLFGGGETNEDRANKFIELGCTTNHRVKKPDGKWGCMSASASYDTGVQHTKKDKPALSISANGRMMYDVECTRDADCAKLIWDSSV